MNKKLSVGIAVSLVLIAVTITFTTTMIFAMKMFDSKVSSAQERAQMYNKLSEVDKIIRQNFYGEIDDAMLLDAASRGMVLGLLDENTTYLTSEELAFRNTEMQGTSVSTGLSIEKNTNGYAVITNVASESPADKMALQIGDIITKIDGKDVLAMGYDAVQTFFQSCSEGTKIEIVYNRDGEETTVELTPITIESASVVHSQIDDIYFIRVDRFTNLTTNQFKAAVDAAEAAENCNGIVIDLRDLYGGYDLSIIADMLDRMMPTGTLISGNYKDGKTKVLYTSDEQSVTMPVSVIVNEFTAGFAEAFAAVMSDAQNCNIVGKTTMGLGNLQQLFKLTDGSGVDVTVATLVTGSGLVFNENGVKPDYDIGTSDSFIRLVTPSEQTDPQFKRAAELIRTAR